MCDDTTTKLCDNLAAIAIATTMDPTFGEWMCQLEVALRNKVAAMHRPDRILHGYYIAGLSPSFVAHHLDETFEELQPVQQ